MSDPRLLERMADFHRRQLSVLDAMEKGLSAFVGALTPASEQDLAELAAEQGRATRRLAELEEEGRALRKEWDAAVDIPVGDRRRIDALAEQAHVRAQTLLPLVEQAQDRSRDRAGEIREALQTLRKGHGLLSGYRAGGADGAGRLDRKV